MKERVMDITTSGPGEVVVRFIDRAGRTLLEEKLVISGSASVTGIRTIELSVQVADERVPLAPVLVRQVNTEQRVTFDGDEPATFTRTRCEEIGCAAEIVKAAESGNAAPIERGIGSMRSSDGGLLNRALRAAALRANPIKGAHEARTER
jgi:hypothetical protein